jgi:hypothetical protein
VSYGPGGVKHVHVSDDSLVFDPSEQWWCTHSLANGAVLAGYDAARHRMVWFQDRSGGYSVELGTLWFTLFDDGVADPWQSGTVPGAAPGGRGFMGLAYDPSTSRVLIDGGQRDNGVNYGDTWSLRLQSDLVTATLASLVEASSTSGGVTLRWDVTVAPGTPCRVEHSADAVSWADAGSAEWTAANAIRFTAPAIAAGTREAYRLRIAAVTGDVVESPLWLDGPHAAAALAISPAANPTRGVLSFRLALSGSAPAHVRLFDVGGRLVRERDVSAGAQVLSLGDAPSPGLYFAVLEQAGKRSTARVVATP